MSLECKKYLRMEEGRLIHSSNEQYKRLMNISMGIFGCLKWVPMAIIRRNMLKYDQASAMVIEAILNLWEHLVQCG
jgi:hypothetical protein